MLYPSQMYKIKAHSSYSGSDNCWICFDIDSVFYVMAINEKSRKMFVTNTPSTPFTEKAITGFAWVDYFWIYD